MVIGISKKVIMKTSYIEALGFLAAILGTFSLVPQPQVIKTFKSKSVRDISLSMCLIVAADSILWLSYGVILHLLPLIAQSLITFSAAFIMITLKLSYGKGRNKD